MFFLTLNFNPKVFHAPTEHKEDGYKRGKNQESAVKPAK
jgi:hypothetical protein